MPTRINNLPLDRIADFCRRRRISELAIFGSVLRDDFGPGSDIDVLVTFEAGAPIGLFGFAAAQRELSQILGRPVDLVMRSALIQNPHDHRAASIAATAQVLFAA